MSKISKEELEQLQTIEQKKAAIKNDISVYNLQILNLGDLWKEVYKEEIDNKNSLREKYKWGDKQVNINPENGEVTFIENEENESESN
jgi:hypothetical protein|tara:strand:- start:289 stop:552 length:264 start_codon:yes stop_codon:yes gene_type:complete